MGLFTPAWNSKDSEKRMKAVKKITDIDKLQNIVFEAKYTDIREAAVKKITDQSVLKKIVFMDLDSRIRKVAIENVIDQSVLKEIVFKDSDLNIRKMAVEKITDQEVLKEVIFKDLDKSVREVALSKLNDKEFDDIIYEYIMHSAKYNLKITIENIEFILSQPKILTYERWKTINSIGTHIDYGGSSKIHTDKKSAHCDGWDRDNPSPYISSDCHTDKTNYHNDHTEHTDNGNHIDRKDPLVYLPPYEKKEYTKPIELNINAKPSSDPHEYFEGGIIKIGAKPSSDSQDYYEDGTRKIKVNRDNNN